MLSAEVENAAVIDWTGSTYRLIPSRFPPVNVYEGLIANDRMDELVAAENLTNPRLISQERISLSALGDAKADPRLQNWNLAPFAYGNPDGSLFFGEDRPCMEVATDRQTALAVSVAKRETFLRSTQEAPIGLDMRMLCHPISGYFWDIRNLSMPASKLDQTTRREIGAKIPKSAQGLLYRAAERPAGTCVAILTGDVLERSTQTTHFRYIWDGFRMSLLYAFDQTGTEIDPATLASTDNVLAAA